MKGDQLNDKSLFLLSVCHEKQTFAYIPVHHLYTAHSTIKFLFRLLELRKSGSVSLFGAFPSYIPFGGVVKEMEEQLLQIHFVDNNAWMLISASPQETVRDLKEKIRLEFIALYPHLQPLPQFFFLRKKITKINSEYGAPSGTLSNSLMLQEETTSGVSIRLLDISLSLPIHLAFANHEELIVLRPDFPTQTDNTNNKTHQSNELNKDYTLAIPGIAAHHSSCHKEIQTTRDIHFSDNILTNTNADECPMYEAQCSDLEHGSKFLESNLSFEENEKSKLVDKVKRGVANHTNQQKDGQAKKVKDIEESKIDQSPCEDLVENAELHEKEDLIETAEKESKLHDPPKLLHVDTPNEMNPDNFGSGSSEIESLEQIVPKQTVKTTQVAMQSMVDSKRIEDIALTNQRGNAHKEDERKSKMEEKKSKHKSKTEHSKPSRKERHEKKYSITKTENELTDKTQKRDPDVNMQREKKEKKRKEHKRRKESRKERHKKRKLSDSIEPNEETTEETQLLDMPESTKIAEIHEGKYNSTAKEQHTTSESNIKELNKDEKEDAPLVDPTEITSAYEGHKQDNSRKVDNQNTPKNENMKEKAPTTKNNVHNLLARNSSSESEYDDKSEGENHIHRIKEPISNTMGENTKDTVQSKENISILDFSSENSDREIKASQNKNIQNAKLQPKSIEKDSRNSIKLNKARNLMKAKQIDASSSDGSISDDYSPIRSQPVDVFAQLRAQIKTGIGKKQDTQKEVALRDPVAVKSNTQKNSVNEDETNESDQDDLDSVFTDMVKDGKQMHCLSFL